MNHLEQAARLVEELNDNSGLAAGELVAIAAAGFDDVTPTALLRHLSHHPSPTLRALVCSDPHTPAELLAERTTDPWPAVRAAVATNPSTPRAAVTQLCSDGSQQVRIAVAGRPGLSADDVALCATPPVSLVLDALRGNQTIPREARVELLRLDPATVKAWEGRRDRAVRFAETLWQDSGDAPTGLAVASTLGAAAYGVAVAAVLEVFAEDAEVDVRLGLASDDTTPPELLDRLGRDVEWLVRLVVARHPHAGDDTLELLCGDSNVFVRVAVAERGMIPERVLELLCHDPSGEVISSLARNETVPNEQLDEVTARRLELGLIAHQLRRREPVNG